MTWAPNAIDGAQAEEEGTETCFILFVVLPLVGFVLS